MKNFNPYENIFLLNQRQISELTGFSRSSVKRHFVSKNSILPGKPYYYSPEEVRSFIKKRVFLSPLPTTAVQFLSYPRDNPLKDQIILQLSYLLQFFYEKIYLNDLTTHDHLSKSIDTIYNRKKTYEYWMTISRHFSYLERTLNVEESNCKKRIIEKFLKGKEFYLLKSLLSKANQKIDENMDNLLRRFKINEHITYYKQHLTPETQIIDCFKPKKMDGEIAILSLEDKPISSAFTRNFIIIDDSSIEDCQFLLNHRDIYGIIDCTRNGVFKRLMKRPFFYFHLNLNQFLEKKESTNDIYEFKYNFFEQQPKGKELYRQFAAFAYFFVKEISVELSS